MDYRDSFYNNIRGYRESVGNFRDFFLKELEKIFNIRSEVEELPIEAMISPKARESFIANSEMNLVFDGIDIVFYELNGEYQKKDIDLLMGDLIRMARDRKWDSFAFQRGILEIMGYRGNTDIVYDASFMTKLTMEGKDYN